MSSPDPLLVQGVAFAVAALTGVALGLMLDGYRAIRRALRPAGLAGHALDVVLVAAALPVLAGGMLAANWGEVRVYPLLALAVGATAYLTLASPLLLPIAVWIIRRLGRLSRAVGRLVTAPVRAVARAGQWIGGWIRRPPADGRSAESAADSKPGTASGRTNRAVQTSDRGEGGSAENLEHLGRGSDRRRHGGRPARTGTGSGRRRGTANPRGRGSRRL